ncbi:hypothetical protein SLEP1_g49380 [Rubroshorea leprosula]|uniref:Uncharacterized protein n=1 Tax=Rubroshorea leprosula TaxID=152421 RepID=A0AAV5LXX0_9ROSI|nr:hypothetical protein SLEP1_g49380 [Rubroshorea leprosula]
MASTAPPFFLAQFPTIPFSLQVVLLQPAMALHPTDPFSPFLSLICPFLKTVNSHPFPQDHR